jgi:uncharacterized damage-inducible protein DinB
MTDFDPITAAFLAELRDRLLRMYPDQIRACLNELTDEELWWRPNDQTNSVGNLILHLAGNINHYLGRGVAGTGYVRNRKAEFNEKGPIARVDLLARWESSLEVARQAFDSLTPERLLEQAELGRESQPIARLLVAVTTHYNSHVGQIVYVTKMKKEGTFADELWRRVGDR